MLALEEKRSDDEGFLLSVKTMKRNLEGFFNHRFILYLFCFLLQVWVLKPFFFIRLHIHFFLHTLVVVCFSSGIILFTAFFRLSTVFLHFSQYESNSRLFLHELLFYYSMSEPIFWIILNLKFGYNYSGCSRLVSIFYTFIFLTLNLIFFYI